MDFTDMQLETMDLLSNGPSSFAALFRYCASADDAVTPTPTQLVDEVLQLAEAGLVQMLIMMMESKGEFRALRDDDLRTIALAYEEWLGNREVSSITVDEASLDEVGLWCGLTDEGRKAWEALPER